MKPAALSSLTPLIIISTLALSIAGCNSSKSVQRQSSQPAYRYNASAESPVFAGSNGFQQGQLDSLLKNNLNADPLTLLVAANTAIRQGRLTDAGLLYQQAQIRRITDLQRFPPKPDAQAKLKNLQRLKTRVSNVLGPKLLERPKAYGQIAERLARWRCETGMGYKPSWTFGRTVSGISCSTAQQQKIRLMRDLSVLMAQPEYASAAQLAEYYQNSSSSVRELSGLKESYLEALATMRAIERKQKRIGLSKRF